MRCSRPTPSLHSPAATPRGIICDRSGEWGARFHRRQTNQIDLCPDASSCRTSWRRLGPRRIARFARAGALRPPSTAKSSANATCVNAAALLLRSRTGAHRAACVRMCSSLGARWIPIVRISAPCVTSSCQSVGPASRVFTSAAKRANVGIPASAGAAASLDVEEERRKKRGIHPSPWTRLIALLKRAFGLSGGEREVERDDDLDEERDDDGVRGS